MQTINLKFQKLDRLPVPTSFDEVLFEQTIIGTIYSYVPTYDPIDQWSFEVKGLDSNSTYAHAKVTATETDFKVGDRVKWQHHKAKVIRILQDTKEALIEYSVEVSVMGFPEYNDHETRVPLTDLTLMSKFKVGDNVQWVPEPNEAYPNGSITDIYPDGTCMVFSKHPVLKKKKLTDLKLIVNETT